MYTILVMESAQVGPLAGVRVLELGGFIAGPFAGQLLGDYGADVIKVEDPDGGDPMRTWGVAVDGEGLWWSTLARNKRSVCLDLRNPQAQEVVRHLAAACDIVIENFRPGRLEDWGLGYDILSILNPALVLVRVSGFGQTGPLADQAGFGSIGEAMGGIRHTTGSPDRSSSRSGTSLGDSLAGLFGVIGALAALDRVRRCGRGQVVDVAIYESVAAVMESTLADYEVGGVLRGRTGSLLPGVAPSNVYAARDGAEILIAANADTVFRRLCEAMKRVDLADDARFATHRARGENQTALDDIIAQWTTSRDSGELLVILAEHSVPAGRVFTAKDMLNDPHYLARDMIRRVPTGHGYDIPMTGVVPKFSETPGAIRRIGPRLGIDTHPVLRDVAEMTEDEIAEHLPHEVVSRNKIPTT